MDREDVTICFVSVACAAVVTVLILAVVLI